MLSASVALSLALLGQVRTSTGSVDVRFLSASGDLEVLRLHAQQAATVDECSSGRESSGSARHGLTACRPHEVIEALYEHVCETPCEARLPRGINALAVGRGTDDPLPIEPAVNIASEETVRIRVEDRSGIRALGWILAIGGGAAGAIALAVEGSSITSYDQRPVIIGGTGAATMIVFLGGMLLTGVGDAATLEKSAL